MAAIAEDATSEFKGFTLHPPPEDGAVAWRAAQAEVDALARGETAHVNLDVQDFADRANAVVEELAGNPELLGRFRRLAVAGFFEFAVIDRLARRLPALWYVGHMQKAEAAQPRRRVPETFLAAADERRQRMHRLAIYHREHDTKEGPQLAAMTFTNDQQKLANDLVTLAELYARHHAAFSNDPHFREDDARLALDESRAIRKARGGEAATELTWTERAAALFTLVQRDYQELRATGSWMLRDRPDDARARFPPMIERAARRGKAAEAPADDEEGGSAREEAPANDPPAPIAPTNDTAAPAPAAKDAPAAPVAPAPTATKPKAAKKPAAKKPSKRTAAKR